MIGNMYYCKKDFIAEKLIIENGDFIENILLFKEGNIYECDESGRGIMWVWYNKEGGNYDSGYGFIISNNGRYVDYFYDYFCSIKESRKIKLSKLEKLETKKICTLE